MSDEIKARYDVNGKLIKFHDVIRIISTNEMGLVSKGSNKSGIHGLCVENNFIGLGDWLDVYPDGELEVVGNVDTTYVDR
ncbi:hypothetical protein A1D15_2042 [Lactiplantibacillus plantarum]|uniref:hypothetical protein n=1 Tax=Lactiplantibacillus plantarum TaxID=1590 RepID=UPI0007B559FD|nr:hypothetical protein [Lactiplantibacillus plantarum]KAE9506697.1 hypothetical protein FET70_00096 [Lactiplantibacillus plantarum]KZU92898.1 hypothetical protein A1D15_2042 [Lactiplantibacillus plantarum]MDN7065466.1 hypothetical protein [Lactiplantibacillus plantarum]